MLLTAIALSESWKRQLTISGFAGSGYTKKRRNVVTKTLRVMQLTAIFLLGVCLQAAAIGRSQTIDFSGRNVPLETVFHSVEKQSGVVFVYNAKLLRNSKPVTIDAHNIQLADFLTRVLSDQGLDFLIEKKTVLIERKKADVTEGLNIRLSPSLETPPITVRGRIVDEKGEPVVASIVVKGTNRGALTDAYGNFELNNVDGNAVLIVAGVAIETQEIKVGGRRELIINVATKITSQEEVVISTGYFSSTKKRSTANISRVDAKDIEKQPVSSPLMALQGRMPGVDIAPSGSVGSNAPGSATRILIRGQNNIRGRSGTLPLYIIDGVPIDPTPLSSTGVFYLAQGFDPLSTISPASIDNIQVLKDASATAIYGSRGANGVVLITTKQGDKTGRSAVDINAYTGVAAITNRVDVLNRRQYLDLRYKAFENDGIDWRTGPINNDNYDLRFWDTTRDTDWQDVLLDNTAKINDAQVNFSGGNGKTNFRIGGGYHKETSPINNDFGFERMNGNLSVNHSSANNKLKIMANINYGVSKSKQFNDESYLLFALNLPPIAPAIYDENGKLNWAITNTGAIRNTWENPLSSLLRTHNSQTRNVVGNSTINYNIFKNIEASINIGFTQTNQDEITKNPIISKSPTSINSNTKGSANFGSNARTGFIFEPRLKYSKGFNKHNLEVMLGTSWQGSEYNYTNLAATLYNSDALLNSPQGAGRVVVSSDKRFYRYDAFYAHIGYSYDNKYIVDLSGRRDGSSRFGPGKRFGNFGAVGAAWIFSEERYIHDHLPFLNYGKLRASYGVTGNDQIGDYKYLNTYAIGPSLYQESLTLYPNGIYNPNFAWEETNKLEAALEISAFDNRVSADIAWYRNRTSNQLVDYTLPYTTGFPSIFKNFGATVQNSGWEFSLGVAIVRTANVKWNINANFTVPQTKLVSFPAIETSPYATQFKVGEPLTLFNLYTFKGVNPQTGTLEFEDRDQSGSYTLVDLSLKNVGRINYGGINNILSFRKLQLSIFLQYSNAYQRFIFPPGLAPGMKSNQPVEVLNYWQKPGDNVEYPRPSQNSVSGNLFSIYSFSDGVIKKITFLRLKTLSLSYDVKNLIPAKWYFKDCRIFIEGFNLFTFNQGNYMDPESGYGMPPLKMINIGAQIKL